MDLTPAKKSGMPKIPDVLTLYDNTPSSLYDLCMEYIAANLDTISTVDPVTHLRKIKPDVILPREICESFLEVYQKNNRVHNVVVALFKDRSRTRLERVKLRNARVSGECVKVLLRHQPTEVELVNCDYLTQDALELFRGHSKNLRVLKFEPSQTEPNMPASVNGDGSCMLDAPCLRTLVLHRHSLATCPNLLLLVYNLTELDLSECTSVSSMWGLKSMTNLRSLILHNCFCVQWSHECLDWILCLHQLRHLDISQANDRHGKFLEPNKMLAKIVTGLPHLKSLDISGTNLAGRGAAAMANDDDSSMDLQVRCDIPGLASRVNNPLDFLGLYSTHHGACKRHDIPAKIISGDASEEQILTAAVAYMDRPAMLTRVLNDLYYLFRGENNVHVGQALGIILDAMDKHVYEKHIQISGSASLFYIVKGKEKDRIKRKLKRRIITAVLDGMDAHLGDDTMMRNGCLTLCQFRIPADVLFEYERVVQILLFGVADIDQDGFVERIAIYLLNSLACQVDGTQKQFLGNQGAIGRMLNLISDRLEKGICDDVLEVAWSTMWNVTDETPQNCRRFLENGGMDYFLGCLKAFPNKEELLRNMMGLLGNVAEVAELRPELMDSLFLTVFAQLLNSSSDGIEVSYNAAGVLAHIASDGADAWTVERPLRDAVLSRIAAAVERWDMYAERNINYRSFEPILSLLQAYHTPQCQHWAAWALANLTTVYPDKYCALVAIEGGIELLKQVIDHPKPYERIKELAQLVIKNCELFAKREQEANQANSEAASDS